MAAVTDTPGRVLYDLHHDTVPSRLRQKTWETACDFERARWEKLADKFISRLQSFDLEMQSRKSG